MHDCVHKALDTVFREYTSYARLIFVFSITVCDQWRYAWAVKLLSLIKRDRRVEVFLRYTYA